MKSRSQIDESHWAESITYFDGLGRAWKTEELNSNGNIFVEKEFDAEGRVKRVTNPFRTGETKYWTTNVYDEASRVKEVILQDGATVKTDYGVSTTAPIGVTKTITDQAGKKRKGFTDALGRMVRVVEDPAGQNLNTDYVFDTLGSLRQTIQGTQNRYFLHDSLGRLLYAKQPEQDTRLAFVATDPVTNNAQWSVKYEYDDNSNITKTTDARGIEVTGTYDNLNRIKQRVYSDTTPPVSFYYDGTGLGGVPDHSKGKTTKVSSSVSETRYTSFDNLGRLLTHQQITDGQTYNTSYVYNLSGALIEETYPSTRVVKYTLDANGDLSQVRSKKTASHGFWTYAGGLSYDSAGNVKKMQLGNGLWETSVYYNERLQIKQIGLGVTDADQNLLKLELGYGDNQQNNGSLREQKITVPGIANQFIQTYVYDDLNRLKSATETNGGNETWKQTFEIDRYGNREFDPANTTTLGSCATAVCNPDINAANDNRFSLGQGYGYDQNGNVTQDAEGQRFGYDAENHQKELFAAGNGTSTPDATYLYDGDGRRVKKITSTEITVFVYNANGQLVAEYSTALATAPQVSYLTTDHLGSPRVVTNENGTVKDRKDYSAFGEESASAQRSANSEYSAADQLRKNYTGYEKDGESGLEFAQARYYNPRHGRFTSVDPLTGSGSIKNPQTFNRYSYVLNSPYKYSDPLGLIPESTAACGSRCPNSGPWVDGSAFRGRDASFDWAQAPNLGIAAASHEAAHQEQQEPIAPCPPNCPPSVTSPTDSPPLPEGWTIQGGALVKTDGPNNVGSVTVSASEEAAAASKKKGGGWLKGIIRVIVRGARGAWGFVAGELIYPSQSVGDPGVSDAPSPGSKVLNTFEGARADVRRLEESQVFYRIYGPDTDMNGAFFSRTAYSSEATARRELALKREWGDNARFIVAAVAPAGTLVYEGRAASQGPGYPGGGSQVFIPNRSGLVFGRPTRLGP